VIHAGNYIHVTVRLQVGNNGVMEMSREMSLRDLQSYVTKVWNLSKSSVCSYILEDLGQLYQQQSDLRRNIKMKTSSTYDEMEYA